MGVRMPLELCELLGRRFDFKRLPDLINFAILPMLGIVSLGIRLFLILIVVLSFGLTLLKCRARLLLVLGCDRRRRRVAASYGHAQHRRPRQALGMFNVLLVLAQLALCFACHNMAVASLVGIKAFHMRIFL